ncbi:MAG: LytTR family DNA-binding domain-containing protein [Bacteroidia bacterium]|jgi:DNA-binding LytR/AlgR family response regulator|nr:LytTR family DNA-binding domain-containing protein [Bacteroidia bacterium]
MNCLIVDDNRLALMALEQLVAQVDNLTFAGSCESATQAYNRLRNEKIDLLLLDIELPDMSGLDLLRSLERKPLVILITAKTDYAVEAFELNVVDYLVKPVNLQRFLQAIEKARVLHEQRKTSTGLQSDFVFVRSQNQLVKIRLEDILYIQALGDYITIHTTDKRFTIHMTLRSVEEKLPSSLFLRIHRSWIAALHHIDSVEENVAKIGNASVPIGEQYRPLLIRRLHLL